MAVETKTSVINLESLNSINVKNSKDAGYVRSLIRSSTTLTKSVHRDDNSIHDMARVSKARRKARQRALGMNLPVAVDSLQELEDSTGYGTVKEKTTEVFEDIKNTGTVEKKSIRTLSAGIKNRLEVVNSSKILSLVNALAPVDEYLQRHSINVSMLNGLFGQWLGLSKVDVYNLVLIGLLHDCGKALIPSKILQATRKLTVTEFEVIKMHPVHSYELLSGFPETVRRAARNHHEFVNGSGYPDCLSNFEISLFARITSISDVYDAIVSQRSYKKALSPFHALDIIEKSRSSALDTVLVNIFFLNIMPELIDKPVVMSDGTVGIFREFDYKDPRYPMIEVNGKIMKTGEDWYCESMYIDD